MKGLGHHFGGSGAPFWSHFGGLGGFWLPNASWKAFWAALGRISKPRWLQLEAQEGSKLEPKRHKNRCENRSKHRWLWKSIFEWIFIDFRRGNEGKLELKWNPNSILSWKCREAKSAFKTNRISMILWVRRSQVGNQNRSKIDQNLKSKMECLLASIFNGFWWVLGANLGWKIDPRSIKNRSQRASEKW